MLDLQTLNRFCLRLEHLLPPRNRCSRFALVSFLRGLAAFLFAGPYNRSDRSLHGLIVHGISVWQLRRSIRRRA